MKGPVNSSALGHGQLSRRLSCLVISVRQAAVRRAATVAEKRKLLFAIELETDCMFVRLSTFLSTLGCSSLIAHFHQSSHTFPLSLMFTTCRLNRKFLHPNNTNTNYIFVVSIILLTYFIFIFNPDKLWIFFSCETYKFEERMIRRKITKKISLDIDG